MANALQQQMILQHADSKKGSTSDMTSTGLLAADPPAPYRPTSPQHTRHTHSQHAGSSQSRSSATGGAATKHVMLTQPGQSSQTDTHPRHRDHNHSNEPQLAVFESPEQSEPSGALRSSLVHATGVWTKEVHVWVLDVDGRLLLRRRARDLPLCPDCWDVSASATLIPDEDVQECAIRALAECLGMSYGPGLPELQGPMAGCGQVHEATMPGAYRSAQIIEVLVMRGFNPTAASLHLDMQVTSEAVFMALSSLHTLAASAPATLTPWLRHELATGVLDNLFRHGEAGGQGTGEGVTPLPTSGTVKSQPMQAGQASRPDISPAGAEA